MKDEENESGIMYSESDFISNDNGTPFFYL